MSALRLCLTLTLALAASPLSAHAAGIGDACDPEHLCPPTLFCFPVEGNAGYCSGACPEAGCPEGFQCRAGGGPQLLCLKGDAPMGAGIGEPCEGPDACEPPLTCFSDGMAGLCSRYCTVPGSCPVGFRCHQGAMPACQPQISPPTGLEPCAMGACAMGWDCLTHPSRDVAFCALPCPDGACNPGLACVDGHCLADPLPFQPAFGERCVADGAEPRVVGCKDGGLCLLNGAESYCTRACDIDVPCEMGYGCKSIMPGQGECRRGVPSDEVFVVMAFPDGGFPDPPDATPAPMQAVEQEGGSDEGKAGQGDASACQMGTGDAVGREGAFAVAIAALLLGGRRRRRS